MRVDAFDHLAVELEHEAQDTVRRRVLRPEIEREVALRRVGHSVRPLESSEWRIANSE
jgi:hypothetical protein